MDYKITPEQASQGQLLPDRELIMLGAHWLAAADSDPAAGSAAYESRMRDYVLANQGIGRLHVDMLINPDPNAGCSDC